LQNKNNLNILYDFFSSGPEKDSKMSDIAVVRCNLPNSTAQNEILSVCDTLSLRQVNKEYVRDTLLAKKRWVLTNIDHTLAMDEKTSVPTKNTTEYTQCAWKVQQYEAKTRSGRLTPHLLAFSIAQIYANDHMKIQVVCSQRHSGWGKYLMHEMLTFAQQNQCQFVELQSCPELFSYYADLGFVKHSIRCMRYFFKGR